MLSLVYHFISSWVSRGMRPDAARPASIRVVHELIQVPHQRLPASAPELTFCDSNGIIARSYKQKQALICICPDYLNDQNMICTSSIINNKLHDFRINLQHYTSHPRLRRFGCQRERIRTGSRSRWKRCDWSRLETDFARQVDTCKQSYDGKRVTDRY
jgi:hypothetical protein